MDLSDPSLWLVEGYDNPSNYGIIEASETGAMIVNVTQSWESWTNLYLPIDTLPRSVIDTDYSLTMTLWQSENNRFSGKPPVAENCSVTVYTTTRLGAFWTWHKYLSHNQTCYGDSTSNDGCEVTSAQELAAYIPVGESNAEQFSTTFQVDKQMEIMQLVVVLRFPASWPGGKNLFMLSDISFERHPRARSFPQPLDGIPELVEDVRAPVVPNDDYTDCPHLQDGLVDWHDPTIWGGSVPTSGDVTLPEDTKVLISSCSLDGGNSFGTITVPENSSLVFNDADIELNVGNILVNGHFAIGSPTCRIRSYITITLLDSADDLGTHIGRKGIVSTSSGQLDIHGKLYQKTWTRLASSVQPLDDRIQVTDDINWEVGQQVVVVTSIWREHEDNQNEVRTIAAIEGRKIQFTEPLQFFHYAGPEYQVEVALLSRRILIQGDEASEDSRVGGHVMSHGAQARLSGVQGYRMGQTNVLARYPFHFHLMGSSPESFIQDCSVYHSFFRCFTIHGTNDTRVSRNTAYDVLGHCYYLEDGVEEGNLFEYNFAAHPLPVKEVDFSKDYSQQGVTIEQAEDLLIPADAAPSGFYISNSNNQFVGNAGSGGFAVFSFINFPTPIGDFKNLPNFVPMERPFGRFYGNSAHSAAYQWSRAACIYVGGLQEYNPEKPDQLLYNIGRHARNTRDIDGDEGFFVFEENRAFICNRGLNHWGQRVEAIGYEAHDVTKGITMFGDAYLKRTLIEGRSGNPLNNFPDQRGFEWYDIYVQTIISDITFRNFAYAGPDDPDAFSLRTYAITSLTHSDKYKPQGINAARGIKFENVWEHGRLGNKIRDTGASRFYNIMDWDNSILNHPRAGNNKVVLGSANNQTYESSVKTVEGLTIQDWWLFDGNDCVSYPEYIMWACIKHDDNEIVSINLDVDGYTNDFDTYPGDWKEQDPRQNYGTVSQFGFSGDERRAAIITANPGVTGLSGDYGWYIYFDAGSPQDFRIRMAQLPNVDGNHMHIIAAIKYPNAAEFDFQTWHENYWLFLRDPMKKVDTFEEVYQDESGLSYTEQPSNTPGEKWLIFKMINRSWDNGDPSKEGFFERDGIRLYNAWAGGYSYLLTVTCTGCESVTVGRDNAVMYPVKDEVPPFVSQLRAAN